MKKVLLIIIDALAARVVNPAIDAGRLPHLQQLRAAAELQGESIAIFPSITPAATSSLITGRYPRQHGISGAYWYIPEQKQVIYYGYDIWAVLEEGIDTFLKDFLVKLNEEHLQRKTFFQMVEEAGQTAASLNYLIYHGDYPHSIEMPLALKILTATTIDDKVCGPSLQYFGDLIQTPLSTGETLDAPGGMFNRYGFTDQTTAALLKQLIEEGNMPDFTLAYFPGNDFRSHEVGPEAALDQIEALDEELGQIFATYGGLDKFLSDVTIVLTGDHSQSDVVSGTEKAGIRLDELLESFAVAEAGTPMEDEDDLVVCPNLRTAQIYFHSPSEARFRKVVDCLLPDARVDQVLWSAGLLNPDQRGYHVMTAERGHLHFWPGAEGPQSAQDRFGNLWSWEGDLRAVDGTVETGDVDRITFDDYPNAFERIAGILDLDVSGHLWVTSRPGYEFCLAHTKIHPEGGSHGSLHRLDSVSPLWVAG
ncbi:MAG: alkaline phosphatase family protein, partial [Caldilineaceae bacterium]|nr:alkaline phosphatase family protein [Caldilineaceae bacterium]